MIFAGLLALKQFLFYASTNILKNLRNIKIILSTALNKLDSIFFGKISSFLTGNLSILLINIRFIANNDFAHVFRLSLVDLFYPVLKIVKGFSISNWIYQDNSSCAFVVRLCDCFKELLACGVPDLHFNFYALDIDCFDFKIYSDRWDMGHFILLIYVS